jgi:hypothetical protein
MDLYNVKHWAGIVLCKTRGEIYRFMRETVQCTVTDETIYCTVLDKDFFTISFAIEVPIELLMFPLY